MYYCLVEEGQVAEGPKPLPKNWKNISNLPSLSVKALSDVGWWPVTYSGIVFNPAIQKRLADTYTTLSGEVMAVYHYENKTAEELAEDEAAAAAPVVIDDLESISYIRTFLKAKFEEDVLFPDELK